MQEKFDMSYVLVLYPFGLNNRINFLEIVNKEFIAKEKERIERISLFLHGIYDTPVAVVAKGVEMVFGSTMEKKLA